MKYGKRKKLLCSHFLAPASHQKKKSSENQMILPAEKNFQKNVFTLFGVPFPVFWPLDGFLITTLEVIGKRLSTKLMSSMSSFHNFYFINLVNWMFSFTVWFPLLTDFPSWPLPLAWFLDWFLLPCDFFLPWLLFLFVLLRVIQRRYSVGRLFHFICLNAFTGPRFLNK